MIIQLTLRYEHSTTLILHKLFEFFIIFGWITTYNFGQINIITLNYAYYKIGQLKHR
jgi:hypothetical protein